MSDIREGVVRLSLPDGRSLALQLTYERIDAKGHGWVLERLDQAQRAKAGSSRAVSELLELLTGGAVLADEVMASSAAKYPLGRCMPAIWAAWELAYYGSDGKPEPAASENPQKRRPTLLRWLIGRR